MTYLALARKWRPKTFAELVGQEHVVSALRQALDTGRVHHAFLFTGTRGVGKTTIARIFAKSLNCEGGISSEPCGECAVCRDVDAGRFIDLIEIDAASNTGVDDVRELIESAQYGPARGRYKVFLIDEVHMLSRSAFNALLKTLEEPPGHVKFLLATTDPQKLPVTVLSRCLQFNLRRLTREEIARQMAHILAAEDIAAEPAALELIAIAADGSVRDGLSLLDQAIVHGAGKLTRDQVQTMLGTLDQDVVLGLLEALVAGDGAALQAAIEAVAAYVVDYADVLQALASALHRIQLCQLLPDAASDEVLDPARMQALATAMSPEDVQLHFQLATVAARDVELAPTPRIGFEMGVLRMLAFRPEAPAGGSTAAAASGQAAGRSAGTGATASSRSAAVTAASHVAEIDAAPSAAGRKSGPTTAVATDVGSARDNIMPVNAVDTAGTDRPPAAGARVQPASSTATVTTPAIAPATATQDDAKALKMPVPQDATGWAKLLPHLALTGPEREMAENCTVLACNDGELRLGMHSRHEFLLGVPRLRERIEQRILAAVDRPVRLRFEIVAELSDTPAVHSARQQQARQTDAETRFTADPHVQAAMQALDAQIAPGSIRPRSG